MEKRTSLVTTGQNSCRRTGQSYCRRILEVAKRKIGRRHLSLPDDEPYALSGEKWDAPAGLFELALLARYNRDAPALTGREGHRDCSEPDSYYVIPSLDLFTIDNSHIDVWFANHWLPRGGVGDLICVLYDTMDWPDFKRLLDVDGSIEV